MKLAVSDANIFIDLIRLGILDLLFACRIEIHTTQEVVDQLNQDQSLELALFIHLAQLKVYRFSASELTKIIATAAPRSPDIADRSVTWLSIRLKAIVLTGDAVLRKYCEQQQLEVRGIIWFFDHAVTLNLLDPADAARHLENLLRINPRLPKHEVHTRTKQWSGR